MLLGTPTRSYLHDLFRTSYVTNPGAFLSLGYSLPPTLRYWFLTVFVGLGLLALVAYALWSRHLTSVQVVGLGLITSGGLSNWLDRARFNGQVVDFLNVGIGNLRTGIFNVADVAIFLGAGVLFWASRNPRPAQR
jgi:signal peptidase II